ncbi:hypothetical protein [Rubellicoccus peritrichatus]|uniref:Uncharacterized protein n=1 Tax=Rubellicoccus peritrichatus TaxID=3080537 RepID=A0AAQ3L9K0_9BACT|nr:hypothetical protein [Puniceicoccus sp. CR14]WOO39358.1 hypothetical protein RZN69_12100 [Puniceicoccus sp. CR14]
MIRLDSKLQKNTKPANIDEMKRLHSLIKNLSVFSPTSNPQIPMQYRHGDVMVEKVKALPSKCKKLQHRILAHGEITGHSHRIKENEGVTLYETPKELFLEVKADVATLSHEEHHTIQIPRGYYRVWRQREYSPNEIRVIRD